MLAAALPPTRELRPTPDEVDLRTEHNHLQRRRWMASPWVVAQRTGQRRNARSWGVIGPAACQTQTLTNSNKKIVL